jgi:uncharacterized phage protein (TIGR01671 family)
MREIRFRAWDKEIEGMYECGTILDILKRQEEMSDRNWLLCTDHVIMQYTGLCDKNGKEICEGDIVSFKPNSIEFPEEICIYEVVWFEQNCGFLFKINNDRYEVLDAGYQDRLAVIGNIYENPELLKEL